MSLATVQISPTGPSLERKLGGGCIFIYSCFARQISFQIDQFEFDLKKIGRAEHEYMNIHPPINILATALISHSIARINVSDSCSKKRLRISSKSAILVHIASKSYIGCENI